ncbi:MAG: four helix bundle protein [Flavobacteriales bacterium]
MKSYNPWQEKSLDFAVLVVNASMLLKERRAYELSSQFVKSGTSIGANIWEAQGAESRRDFVHKLKISSKESFETIFWIKVIQRVYPDIQLDDMVCLLDEIQRILSAAIKTSKNRM